jgi:hypothetical protein
MHELNTYLLLVWTVWAIWRVWAMLRRYCKMTTGHEVTFGVNVQLLLPALRHGTKRQEEQQNDHIKASQLTEWQCNCLPIIILQLRTNWWLANTFLFACLSLTELPRSWKEWFMTKEDAHLDPAVFVTTPGEDQSLPWQASFNSATLGM